MSSVTWYPPDGGTAIVFDGSPAAPYRLVALNGLGPITGSLLKIRSPGQIGETAVDSIVPVRILTVQLLIMSPDLDSLWAMRNALSRALVSPPARRGTNLELGYLRFDRGSVPPLELRARPVSVAMDQPRNNSGVLAVDIDFECPYPYWKDVADTVLTFAQAGGFQWSVEFPLEMTSNNVEQEVGNLGDVDAPILARLYGDATTVRIINVTTDETLEVTGQVVAGDYIEVSTAFGDKRIELVTAAGVRTSIMNRLNLAKADFWSLRPGINVVRFEASTNVSGRAEIYWRQRYAGA